MYVMSKKRTRRANVNNESFDYFFNKKNKVTMTSRVYALACERECVRAIA